MPLQTHPTPWKLAGQTALFLLLLWFTVSVFAAPSIVTVDTGGIDDVGQYTSLELNGAGNAVISYYDVTNGDLKLAICNNALCGAPTVIVLASAGVVGQYTSLELDITAGGVPVISFYDSLNTALNLVVCSDAVCTTTTLTVVDAPGVVGNYTSLALNGSNPVISYYDNIGGNLKLAVCSNPTCTVSTIVSPDAGGNVGRDTSIALNGGNPVISYFDLTNTNLKLLVCNDAVCASDLPITLDTLNTVGTFTSLSLTGAGNPVISYRDDTNSSLKVVICPNPACTGAVPITVDNAGNVGSNTSLTLTAGGCPVISYYDSAGALKVARPGRAASSPMISPVRSS